MIKLVILEKKKNKSYISSISSDNSKTDIIEQNLKQKRDLIKMWLSRRNKLNKLVSELDIEILFINNIW